MDTILQAKFGGSRAKGQSAGDVLLGNSVPDSVVSMGH